MPARQNRTAVCNIISLSLGVPWLHETRAHNAEAPTPVNFLHSWNTEPWLLAAFLAAATLYCLGTRRMRSSRSRQKLLPPLCFWSAMAMLFIALISPLGPLGTALGSAHMLQHMILFFAAPLLIMSYPLATSLWALPRPWRVQLSRRTQHSFAAPLWRAISSASFAWVFHAVILWAWHSPPLYQAALNTSWLHHLEHFSFLLSGLLLWWAIFRKTSTGLLLLFTTMLHGGLLAALLTFSSHIWYPYYTPTTAAWGMTPLEDQQLAGMVMWVLGGFGYLLAGLAIIGLWLKRLEGATPIRRPASVQTAGSIPQSSAVRSYSSDS